VPDAPASSKRIARSGTVLAAIQAARLRRAGIQPLRQTAIPILNTSYIKAVANRKSPISMPFRLRYATDRDADAIAELFFASYRLLTFLPMVHTIENRRFVTRLLLKECVVTVIEDDTGIISFLALQGEEVRQFYTRPDRIGRGAGTQLIEAVKSSGVLALELWCFQANARARRFYEARGFRAIRFTDGVGNEERMPDVRYRWDRL
jgi:GNAT superfamily N-acetyltransferase